jgi:predicted anti-sigma-YlaC factor YlaD
MIEADCRRVFERLSEYLDGELTEELRRRIEGHMDGCRPCRLFLESLERTVRLIGASDAPPMPDDVRRAVHEAWKRCREDQD